jgi:hypothetical protein
LKQLTLFDDEIRLWIAKTRSDLDWIIATHANDPWELAQTIDKEKA